MSGECAVLVARRATDLHGLRDLEARRAVNATVRASAARSAATTARRHKDVNEPQRQAVCDGVLLGGRNVRPLAKAVIVLVAEVDVRRLYTAATTVEVEVARRHGRRGLGAGRGGVAGEEAQLVLVCSSRREDGRGAAEAAPATLERVHLGLVRWRSRGPRAPNRRRSCTIVRRQRRHR